MNSGAAQDWPRDIFDALAVLDVRQVAYVPDAGHKELLARCAAARALRMVVLTTEEEGIALLAGAWLGGERGVLLMQSSAAAASLDRGLTPLENVTALVKCAVETCRVRIRPDVRANDREGAVVRAIRTSRRVLFSR